MVEQQEIPDAGVRQGGGPWVMRMTWRDLLFAHWPVDAAALRGHIPPRLEVDSFRGQAWIGVVPFHMTGIRLRGLPPLPGTSAFIEMNVRTYVTDGRYAGVWFFSLDATSKLAIAVARRWYHLNYLHASMSCRTEGQRVVYASARTRGEGRFEATYGPVGPVKHAQPGTLEHWLTERYVMFAADGRGRVYRGHIEHDPWPLQPAEAEVRANTMGRAIGVELPGEPALCHFSRALSTRAGLMNRIV